MLNEKFEDTDNVAVCKPGSKFDGQMGTVKRTPRTGAHVVQLNTGEMLLLKEDELEPEKYYIF